MPIGFTRHIYQNWDQSRRLRGSNLLNTLPPIRSWSRSQSQYVPEVFEDYCELLPLCIDTLLEPLTGLSENTELALTLGHI
jgi:hypothetical protein